MKNMLTVAAMAVVIGLSGQAQAQFQGPTIAPVSVADAKKLSDDTAVILVGNIEKDLGGEKYLFRDKTDSVTLDIDNDKWNGVTITPSDTIEIRGEVDKEFMNVEIDVDQIIKK